MIRAATPDDMPVLLEMGRAFHEEAGYAEMIPFDPASFEITLAALGQAQQLLVVVQDGRVTGMAAVSGAPSLVNHSVICAREVFWYGHPDFRKGIGRPLLNALECTARNQGAAFFDVVAENGKRDEALARLYRAAEFSPVERTFRKRL